MIFAVGSTFVFGSWICIADDSDQLQSRLMEILVHQVSPAALIATLDLLAEKFSHLSISDPSRAREAMESKDSHSDTSNLSGLEIQSEVQLEDPSHFPLGLKNSTSIYQDTISYFM